MCIFKINIIQLTKLISRVYILNVSEKIKNMTFD